MTLRPTRMEVRLDNIRANYGAIRKHLDEHGGAAAKIFGVIKANAYNLGAVPVAWALREAGADYFFVATPDEALELRAGGIVDPVLVLGASPYDAALEYVRYGIRATITDMEMAHALSAAAEKLGKRHLSTSRSTPEWGASASVRTKQRRRSRGSPRCREWSAKGRSRTSPRRTTPILPTCTSSTRSS